MLTRTNSKGSLASKSSVLDPLKHLVENVQEKNKAWRRRGTVPSTVPVSALEAVIEPQRKLAANMREMAQQLAGCFENVRTVQRCIMRSVQEYLGFDLAGVDESLLALVQACSSFFESCDAAMAKSGLTEVCAGCERVLRECEQVSGAVNQRDQSYKEWKHYEGKVAELSDAPVQGERDREKLRRNKEKLANARQIADESRQICEDELRMFVERRTVFARVTIHSLLRTYSKLLAGVCHSAAAVTEAFDDEFRPGTSVELAGLQKAAELNGTVAAVDGFDAASGRYTIVMPDGAPKLIAPENLIPLDTPSQGSGGGASKSSRSASKGSSARIKVTPDSGPCAGCEVDVAVEGFSGQVQEVFFGGERAELLESSEGKLRVRAPPNSAKGRLRVEVRAAGWRQYIASDDAAFSYFESMGFGSHGNNVTLSAPSGSPPNVAPAIASRTSGLVQGVALTASPLPVLLPSGMEDASSSSTVFPLRYYYELEVLELMEQRSSRTMALGFAWPLSVPPAESSQPDGSSAPKAAEPAWLASGRLPENASALPRSFVVGGDLPKVHLAGKELGKVSGWRPLLDVAVGSVLGALLEVDVTTFRLVVFQDGVRRFSTEGPFQHGWAGAPYGVVDVCGTVRSVQLRQGAHPPAEEAAPAAAAEASGAGAEAPAEAAAPPEVVRPAEAGGDPKAAWG